MNTFISGYMLSRESVRMLVEKGLPDPKICSPGPAGAEDAEIGKSLPIYLFTFNSTIQDKHVEGFLETHFYLYNIGV